MKNIYLSILIPFLFFGITGQAQNQLEEKGQQLVYFEDGSVVKGVIVEYRMNDKLIMLVSGQEVELPARLVQSITRGRQGRYYERQLRKKYDRYDYAFSEQGLYNVSSISINMGADFEGTTAGLSLQHVIGYQLNRWVGFGVGGSLDLFNFGEIPFISVFGDVRGYLTPTKVAPFYAFQMGYGFLNDQGLRAAQGGLLVYPAVGVRFGARSGANMSLDLGYKYQKAEWENGWWDSYTILNYRYHRYVFRVSLTF